MPQIRFTARKLASLPAPERGQVDYFSDNEPGFAIRVAHGGSKRFFVKYILNSKQRRMSLGQFPRVGGDEERSQSLAEARREMIAIKADVAKGRDPAAERQAERHTAITAPTLKELADEFLKRHAIGIGRDPSDPHKRSWREDQRIINTYLKSWHGRKAGSISRREVIALLDDIADRAPVMANRTLACLRKLYNYGVVKDRVGHNPAHQVPPPGGAERSRDRIYDAEEIRSLWAAFDGLVGDIYRLVLATGQRSGEVAGMTWNEIDFDSATWTVPAARMKSKRVHIVPLSEMALSILRKVSRLDDEFVFPSPKPGQPIKNLGKAAVRAKVKSGVADFRSHDLRRTCGTGITKLGFSRFIMNRCLGHLEPGVGGRYDRHDYLPEKTAALDSWGSKLTEILTGEPMPENVVELAERRQ